MWSVPPVDGQPGETHACVQRYRVGTHVAKRRGRPHTSKHSRRDKGGCQDRPMRRRHAHLHSSRPLRWDASETTFLCVKEANHVPVRSPTHRCPMGTTSSPSHPLTAGRRPIEHMTFLHVPSCYTTIAVRSDDTYDFPIERIEVFPRPSTGPTSMKRTWSSS